MKKIFTLMLALFAMVAVQAQSLLSEDFENGIPATWLNVDADNDGNSWLSSAGVTGVAGHNGTDGCAYSCSYYNSTVLTPDNWLITPAVTLTGNSDLTFWVAAQDASYAAEHYGVYISTTGTATSNFTLLFEETIDANGGAKTQGTWKQKTISLASYTGQTVYIAFRHFNCTDMFYLNIDEVEISAQPTDPTISVNPTSADLGVVLLGNSSAAQTFTLINYNLTADVTASTTAPFEVSADGNNFASTATIPAAGGNLYVRYTPTAAGTDNGTITLSSTGAPSVTISLTGTALDCDNITIPYAPVFGNTLGCWTNLSLLEEGLGWFTAQEMELEEGQILSMSAELFLGAFLLDVDVDNWAISPSMTLPTTGSYEVSWGVKPFATAYSGDHYGVYVISGTDTTLLFEETLSEDMVDFVPRAAIIPSTITGDFQIAFRHFNSAGGYVILLDNIQVKGLTAPEVTIAGPTQAENGQPVVFTASCGNAQSFAWTVDGNAVTETSNVLTHTFTTDGNHTVAVTATNSEGSSTASITLEVYTCEAITQFPYSYGFENGSRCWTVVSMDAANDGRLGVFEDPTAYEGSYLFQFSSYSSAEDYNQYLISPELQLPATGNYMVSFFYQGDNSNENFKVMYSTTNTDLSSFTELADYQNVATEWTEASILLPAGTKYVAINYYANYQYYLYIDQISIAPLTAPAVTLNGPTSVQTGESATYTANSPLATSFAWTVDGSAVSSTTNTMTTTFTTSGNHTVAVTVSNSEGSSTASLTVNAKSCNDAQALPFTENFDSGMPACWTILDEDGDGYSWEPSTAPVSYFSGVDLSGTGYNDSYGFILSGSYSNALSSALSPDNWLITPALSIPSEGAKLSFYVAAQDEDYANEHYGVYVSTTNTNASSFTLLYEEDLDAEGGPRAGGAWKQKNVNLPYGGQTIYLAIRHFNCNDQFLIDIDDFTVTAGVGIENHDVNTVVFPNPAKDVLNINSTANINRVEVYNMMGQMVGMYNVNDMNAQINTTNFSNGVYTVKIATENGTTTKKFTVAR